MMILLRHDSTAQVIIHTANMIPFDWTNMTQAVWKSPLLPLIDPSKPSILQSTKIGSGSRFKTDLLNYLKAYDTRRVICEPLIESLSKYDFSEVRGALIGSVPGKQDIDPDGKTKWGWLGLSNALQSIPTSKSKAEIAIQISSIASLGATDKWLKNTFFQTLSKSKNPPVPTPNFKIIFPTADEIRRSLNGYQSGNAIHTKILTPTQGKQLAYLKPMLCHWAGDGGQHAAEAIETSTLDAGRKRAAPHIKTYVRFGDSSHTDIDWMLVTSANLSKQAWGEATNAAGEVRVCSYEIGVLVWPELFGDDAKMVPTFKTDTPGPGDAGKGDARVLVGARMPYDLPIVPYARNDVPWCASAVYTEPDWMGQTWKE
jgi:tyrosyl-DNA phosphodiesterase-1